MYATTIDRQDTCWAHFVWKDTRPPLFSQQQNGAKNYWIAWQCTFKVARNEVKNTSFAQCSAHRDSRIWRPKLIEPVPERKRRARADDDRHSNRPTPTHRFCHSAIFRPITPIMFVFFWVSRHRSIILAKKNGNTLGQILRNSRKCVKTWTIENVNWSQKRLGILPSSLWKVFLKFFLRDGPNTNEKKNSCKASVDRAFSQKRENKDVLYFRLSAHFRPYSSAIFHPNIPHIFSFPLSAYDKWWFEQKNHHSFGKSI